MRRTVNSEKQQCFQTAIAFSAAVGGPRTLGTQLWAPAAPRSRGRLGRPQALSLTREVRASVLLSWGAFAPQGTSNDDWGQSRLSQPGGRVMPWERPGCSQPLCRPQDSPRRPQCPGRETLGWGIRPHCPCVSTRGFDSKVPSSLACLFPVQSRS